MKQFNSKRQVKAYGVENFRPMTVKERWEVYSKLNKQQRTVLDEHRKFLVRSAFIKNSYLAASDWEFVDIRIDDKYPNKHNKELYCQCGRRLKYQYVIKSKKNGQAIYLGSQHFRDHLNIPHHVAAEIVKKINNVDVALDEILWLKRQNNFFPKKLWQDYQYLLFLNQFAKVSLPINQLFTKRIADFEQAELPVYENDYRLLEQEINRLNQQPNQHRQEFLTETHFEVFKSRLTQNIEQDILFSYTSVWAKQIQQRMKKYREKPKMPDSYFQQLHEIFLLADDKTIHAFKKELLTFANRGVGKWIQPSIYEQMLEVISATGYNYLFLSQIHPFIREGLIPYHQSKDAVDSIIIKDEREMKQQIKKKKSLQAINDLLADYSKQEQKQLLTELLHRVDGHTD
ncbi:hypothetical protein ACWOAH_02445 [Vagococcus vulneris]|uniref:Uncharacterized protein n=1 Tax=Vagococcus vulneris TaxID=1977869 RepID=A0A430A131_9ENTE|nr:hypothetical protein [Vagococcus vulneris]RSU00082.1 hypothetical protein CBF37_01920 [Vagococcus vulneris]